MHESTNGLRAHSVEDQRDERRQVDLHRVVSETRALQSNRSRSEPCRQFVQRRAAQRTGGLRKIQGQVY